MKAYAIIITIALIACLTVIFWPSSPSTEKQTLINQRDDNLLQIVRKQKVIDSITTEVTRLKEEVVDSKADVKRSEDNLSKALHNEKVLLKQVKTLSLSMSEVQADSAIMERFKLDPDSLDQKTIYEFARLDECDSIRAQQDQAIFELRNYAMIADSSLLVLDNMNKLSRSQVSLLLSSLDIDKRVLENKDIENKKLKRRNRVLKVLVPVAVVLTVVLMI